MSNSTFWESHYQRFRVVEPSAFARYCVDQWIDQDDLVIEIGCGNGRDGQYIADHCAEYIAIDSSESAIRQFSTRIADTKFKARVSLHCAEVTRFAFDKIETRPEGKTVLYSRFSMHSIDENSEKFLFDEFLRLRKESLFMLEARTVFDPLFGMGTRVSRNTFVTDHYRRFLDPRDYLAFAMEKASIKYFGLSDGFAKTETENPIVMRMVIKNTEIDIQ